MPQDEEFSAPGNGPATSVSHLVALIPGVLLCIVVAGVSADPRSRGTAPVRAPLCGGAGAGDPARHGRAQLLESVRALAGRHRLQCQAAARGGRDAARPSISFAAIAASGAALLGAIVATVVVTLGVSFGISRMLGLSTKLSILIACGNSICGNSAIAAVAPVIGADGDDIASSISFTAILGVMMVLGLPLLIPLLHLSATQYGILAGLTVYAVPQVLAATVPAGLVSTQVGTLVKLVRVLMLGPIVVGLSLLAPRLRGGVQDKTTVGFFRLVPWFILGFLALSVLRSLDIVPATMIGPLTAITGFLTVVSMAALGLGVDVRVLATVGGRVTAAVTLSLMLLLAISIGLVQLFN